MFNFILFNFILILFYYFLSYPQFSEMGSWSDTSFYTPENVTNVVQYGLERGIRILPEFDVPGHSFAMGNFF